MKIHHHIFTLVLLSLSSTFCYADNDYMKALNAEAAELDQTHPASKHSAETVTAGMRTEFESRLHKELRASFRTYFRLSKSHQNNVVSYFFNNGKSMENITIKLLEQYSLQVKNK